MGPFAAIEGQAGAVKTLQAALESGRVHHAYRFEGPAGVGKEKAAFALAQSLVCEAGGPLGCGSCSACRRAVTFGESEPRVPMHPDVVLVQRGLYPAQLLGATSTEVTGIGVDQIRRIVLSRIGYAPHEGRALVFIVRDADELTVSAANALLKTLEEPGPATHFVLLTSRPHRLLDTVRSRTLAVRFAPLPEELIAAILQRHAQPTDVAPLAEGSAALALELADPERMGERTDFIEKLNLAIAAPDLATAIGMADARNTDRRELGVLLGGFAQELAVKARAGAREQPEQAELFARRHEVVQKTMADLELNAQPALALEGMLTRLRRV